VTCSLADVMISKVSHYTHGDINIKEGQFLADSFHSFRKGDIFVFQVFDMSF
jgi:hypothetical protein